VTTKSMARLYCRVMSETGPANSCEYPDGITNPNNPSFSSGYVLVSGSFMTGVGTTWAAISSDWVIPAWSEGHEFQVRAYGKAVNTNGVTWHVWLDNVRGEGPSS